MTPSKELFELIKSMNKTEKRYFKKYSQLHTVGNKNSYLILFDAISKQKEYDEKKLVEKLRNYNFVNHFAVVKNYLYSRILDALENYHRDISIHAKVRRTIHHAELLQKRGLYHHAKKAIHKARQSANNHELYHALLEINMQWEYTAQVESHDVKKMAGIYDGISKIHSDSENLSVCKYIYVKMVEIYFNYYKTRDEKHLKEGDKLFRSQYFKQASKANTYGAKSLYWSACFFYWYAKSNLAAAYRCEEENVNLFKVYPDKKIHYLNNFLISQNNLFTVSMEQEKYKKASGHLTEMSEATHLTKTRSQKGKLFYFYNCGLFLLYFHTGKIAEIEKHLSVIDPHVKFFEDELNNYEKIEVFSTLSLAYYYTGNLKKSLRILNKVRNDFSLSEHPEIECVINLFNLIVHYDASNTESLPYFIQSYYRFLRKKEHINKPEKSILETLRKLPKLDTKEKLDEEFKLLKKKIENTDTHSLQNYFKYFDMISWLKSKIENKSFSEVIKRKALQ